ncbi:hypothetical protein DSO57_1022330 [Entomophthora muscae]|uniref:Uncharacterized protein n=1 Tax=Entomophthora muscae TaxID=34485 RepID=A0ACC2T3A1_9FUNG|nr:hypothetical protein DSO57_1022330 [Entomophthora muscae]
MSPINNPQEYEIMSLDLRLQAMSLLKRVLAPTTIGTRLFVARNKPSSPLPTSPLARPPITAGDLFASNKRKRSPDAGHFPLNKRIHTFSQLTLDL